MKLLTKEIEKNLPALYSTQAQKDPVVQVKFFNPQGAGSWFATEYDPKTRTFFGYVTGLAEDEWGYFSLDEFEAFKGRFGLGIERDMYFEPCPISEVISGKRR